MVKDGPIVGCKIWRGCSCSIIEGDHDWTDDCDRYPQLSALVDNTKGSVDRIWDYATEISEVEYNLLIARSEKAKQTNPDGPLANPHKAVDLRKQQPVF